MDSVSRNLFRALHEGKWLSIEYKNLSGQTTNFWGSVCGLNPRSGMVQVDGMHLHDYTVKRLFLHIGGIQSAKIVEGTWCERNEALIKDIAERPHAYARFFTHITNLKVLDYLAACSQLDSTPYKANYQLIHKIDESQFQGGKCPLTDEQFVEIVTRFQQKTAEPHRPGEPVHITSLGLNLISLNTRQGLYVLAYRPLRDASEETTLISSLAVSALLQNLLQIIFSAQRQPFLLPSWLSKGHQIGPVNLSTVNIITFIVTAIFLVALYFILKKTKIGTAMRACSENMQASRLMGINVNHVVMFSFAIGSGMAVIAGLLLAGEYKTVYPSLGFVPGLKAFCAAVVGGIGSVGGAVAGAFIIGLAEMLFAGLMPTGLTAYRDAFVFLLMVIVLLFCPNGLFGHAEGERS